MKIPFAIQTESQRIGKYLLVGVVNTLVGLGGSLVFFNVFSFDKTLSTILGTILGVVNSYILNSKFTFGKSPSLRNVCLFFFLSGFVYLIAYLPVFWFAGMIKSTSAINGKLIDNLSIFFASGVYTVLGYIVNRTLVFKEKSR